MLKKHPGPQIFHPNISKSGDICVNVLKKDWKSELGIGHVLLTIKCLLIHPNAESALNEEAGKLLLEDYHAYCKHARLITGIHAKVGGKIEFPVCADGSNEDPVANDHSKAVDVESVVVQEEERLQFAPKASSSRPVREIENMPIAAALPKRKTMDQPEIAANKVATTAKKTARRL